MINDILDLSKIEAGKMQLTPKDLPLPEFLEMVVEILRIKAEEKGIFLRYQPTSELPAVIRADEQRLRQVLINLLGNAVKFTEKGGVTFKVEMKHLQESSPYPEASIRFEIADTGIGIAPDQFEKIFLPFEQVGNSRHKVEGTGLGLAISQKIVQMMGSTLQGEESAWGGKRLLDGFGLAGSHRLTSVSAIPSRLRFIGNRAQDRTG